MDKELYRLALITGVDFPFVDSQAPIIIHQPTISEISLIGESEFFLGLQLLFVNSVSFESEEERLVAAQLTSFELFMQIILDPEAQMWKDSFFNVMSLFFPKYHIQQTPNSLLFLTEDLVFTVDNNNFDALCDVLKDVTNMHLEDKEDDFNPVNEAARRIAEKLRQGRKRVAELKKGSGESRVLETYVSAIAVGLRLPITHVCNFTLYQLYDQVERLGLYIKWDIDLRSRLAGATSDEPLENWMKPIHIQKK